MTPYFSWQYQGLSLIVVDRSSGSYTKCLWDFGDGTPVVEDDPREDVTHEYSEAGRYKVSLIVKDDTTTSPPVTMELLINDSAENIDMTLTEMVMSNLPQGSDIDQIEISEAIKKWQTFLAPMVEPAITENIYFESSWSFLQKQLISKLVAYDYLVFQFNTLAMGIGGTGSTSMKGGLKRIETGPSNSEWYNIADIIKGVAEGDSQGQGFLGLIRSDICMLARRLRVHLPICPAWNFWRKPFIIAKRKKCTYGPYRPIHMG